MSTYPQKFDIYPQFYPHLVLFSINNLFQSSLNIDTHISTLTTTRTTIIFMIKGK